MDKNAIPPEQKNLFILITICLFLVLSTTAVYRQVMDHPFISLDDYDYVTENLHVKQGLTLKSVPWAFTSYEASNWHPVTWLSLMLDYEIFGLNPAGYHFTNLLFHVLSIVALFLLLHRATGNIFSSMFAAMLFALHPLHVESVAWVSERKDVLSAFLGFMTIGAYILYTEKPGKVRYATAFILFILGLMAKPMLVTLPFLLLLMDFWPLGRFTIKMPKTEESPIHAKKDGRTKTQKKPAPSLSGKTSPVPQFALKKISALLVEKIPFFLLSMFSSFMTVMAQSSGGAVKSLQDLYLHERIMNALVSYVHYIIKMFWPFNLAVFYPHPVVLPYWQVLGALVLLIAITVFAILTLKRFPFIAVGWFWYLVTLVPVIGIVQVGVQAMADRYAYIPFVGLYIIIAWGLPHLVPERPRRKYAFFFAFAILTTGMMTVSTKQVGYWENSIKLYKHALNVTTTNSFMNFCLGKVLLKNNLPDEALHYYRKAISDNPLFVDSYTGAGQALNELGKYEDAIGYLDEALKIEPSHLNALRNMVFAWQMKGNVKGAEAYFIKALAADPENHQIHYEYGMLLAAQQHYDQAIQHFLTAVKINDHYVDPHIALGNIWILKKEYPRAAENFNRALNINPQNEEAHYGMANTFIKRGKIDEAIHHLRQAIKYKPDYAEAHNDLGSALFVSKKYDEAIICYKEALRLRPDYKMAAENLKAVMEEKEKDRRGNHIEHGD